MNKIKKLFSIIVIFAVLFGVLEYASYKTQSARLVKQGYKFENDIPPYPKNIETFKEYYNNNIKKQNNPFYVSGEKYNTPSILVFGDVLSKSVEPENENDFNNVLSDLTKKPVYNFSNAGWGIQHMYFLLSNEDRLNSLNSDTIIYTYNNDNKNRLTSFSFYPHHQFLNLRYKTYGKDVKEYNPMFVKIYDSYFVRTLERFLGWRFSTSKNSLVQKKNYVLIKNLFENSRAVAQNKYSNFKNFVIVRDVPAFESLSFLERARKHDKIAEIEYNMWQDLISEGFIVIDTNDLINFDYIDYSYKNKDGSFSKDALIAFLPDLLEKSGIMDSKSVIKDKKESKVIANRAVNNRTVKNSQKRKNSKDAWSQIRPEVIGSGFYYNDVHNISSTEKVNKTDKKAKKSFWNRLKFWNKFKKKKLSVIDKLLYMS